jgi:hypothetical protein
MEEITTRRQIVRDRTARGGCVDRMATFQAPQERWHGNKAWSSDHPPIGGICRVSSTFGCIKKFHQAVLIRVSENSLGGDGSATFGSSFPWILHGRSTLDRRGIPKQLPNESINLIRGERLANHRWSDGVKTGWSVWPQTGCNNTFRCNLHPWA